MGSAAEEKSPPGTADDYCPRTRNEALLGRKNIFAAALH
jgi:hypothetical protein